MREQEIQYLEEHIPSLAQSAVTQAYWQFSRSATFLDSYYTIW